MNKKVKNKKVNIKIIIMLAILILSFLYFMRIVVAAGVILNATQKDGMNYIDFSWNAPDTVNKWSYRLYQKTEG